MRLPCRIHFLHRSLIDGYFGRGASSYTAGRYSNHHPDLVFPGAAPYSRRLSVTRVVQAQLEWRICSVTVESTTQCFLLCGLLLSLPFVPDPGPKNRLRLNQAFQFSLKAGFNGLSLMIIKCYLTILCNHPHFYCTRF